MKRPETTSQNHQYAIRRVLIVPSSMLGVTPCTRHSAEACDPV